MPGDDGVRQVVPSSSVYWYPVIAPPPSDAGDVNATVSRPSAGVRPVIVGADGGTTAVVGRLNETLSMASP